MSSVLRVFPITLREAGDFVDQHHRHHRQPRGMIFAISARDPAGAELQPWGVAIFGRPVARERQNGLTREVLRLATRDGAPKGTSAFLYSRCKRAAQTLGYRVMGTYTLASESGDSLRGAGAHVVHRVRGRSWDAPSRPRTDNHPTTDKFLWEWPEMEPIEAAVSDG